MPDDTQIDLSQTVAALRRELEARTGERDEALAREAAMAEVLQVINSSPGDLAPVFDAMLDKALNLCSAAFGALWSYDGGNLHVSAVRGAPSEYEQFLRKGPHQPTHMQQQLLRGRPFEQIA